MAVSGILNHTLAVVIVVVGLLSGALSVMRDLQEMYWPAQATRRRVFWGWVRIAFIIAAVMLWLDEHSKVTQLANEAVIMTVNCDQVFSRIPFSDGKIYLLEPQLRSGGLAIIYQGSSVENFYPVAGFLQRAYRCSVVNYGNQHGFEIRARFVLKTREVKSEGKGTTAGKILDETQHDIQIPEIDGNGASFSFYILNSTDTYLEIDVPALATFELGNKGGKRQQVPLRSSGMITEGQLFLDPLREPSS